MGDSSEGLSSVHKIQLESLQYIDEGDSVYDEDTPHKSAAVYSCNNVKNVMSNGDQTFSSDLLNKPVPPKRDGDSSIIEEVNGIDDFADREPIISQSMILGKEANGFDEAEQIDGTSEEIPTGSSSADSDEWGEEDLSGNEMLEPEIDPRNIGYIGQQKYNDNSNEHSKFGDMHSVKLKTDHIVNGQSNPHKELYSSHLNDEYIGFGENPSYINKSLSRSNNNVYTTYPNKSVFPPSCGLTSGFGSQMNSTRYSPDRQHLPYENQPPFGRNVDLQRMRDSAVKLIGPTVHNQIGALKNMPKAELINLDEASTTEVGKKKKKKKKRNGAIKGDSSDSVVEKKNGAVREESMVHVDKPTVYQAVSDTGAPVMDNDQRSKHNQRKIRKRIKDEKVVKARDIAGHRGSEDVDTLVGFVEGSRKKEKERKGRKQTRTCPIVNGDGEDLVRVDEAAKSIDIRERKSEESKRQTEVTETVKVESDLDFTNFEGLVEADEEMPFEKYVGRKKKARVNIVKQSSQPTQAPVVRGGASMRHWGNRTITPSHPTTTFVRPSTRLPSAIPLPRPPPAKDDFPPLRPVQTLAKPTWNFLQVQQFLETLYPGLKEKCNFYSEASRRAHHVAS